MQPGITGAQRRPGPKPQQHAVFTSLMAGAGLATTQALNEGRGRSPSNTSRVQPVESPPMLVQPTKRRWPKPQQHGQTVLRASDAQRRPGPKPQQHETNCRGPLAPRHASMIAQIPRSTKAGAEAPATRAGHLRSRRLFRSLNEGRGRSPSNTLRARTAVRAQRRPGPNRNTRRYSAQRRPGPKPQQHPISVLCFHAQRRPGPKATQREIITYRRTLAQRRPGPKPQQHGDPREGRRSLNEGRGRPQVRVTLNEGRGRSPSNTGRPSRSVSPVKCAQRRPGPKPQQHSPVCGQAQRRPGQAPATRQSGTSGFAYAQRRPGPKPQQHAGLLVLVGPMDGQARSTKAGAEAPATRHGGARTSVRLARDALNEGRGRSPSNTELPSSDSDSDMIPCR